MISSNGWTDQPTDAYFPDGRVASRGLALSPVTQPDAMHGPPNMQQMPTVYTPAAGPPYTEDPVVQSAFQGQGRSPGQQWPHMPHVEQYNFETSTEIAWHDTPPEEFGYRTERAGWALVGPQGAVMDYYYGQNPGEHQPWNDPIAVEVPGTMPYTALGEVPA